MIGHGKPWDFAHPQKNLMNVLHRSVEITTRKQPFRYHQVNDR
jgi:hypothetical protein